MWIFWVGISKITRWGQTRAYGFICCIEDIPLPRSLTRSARSFDCGERSHFSHIAGNFVVVPSVMSRLIASKTRSDARNRVKYPSGHGRREKRLQRLSVHQNHDPVKTEKVLMFSHNLNISFRGRFDITNWFYWILWKNFLIMILILLPEDLLMLQ